MIDLGGKIKRIDGIYHYCGACRQIEKTFRRLPTTATVYRDYVVFFRYNREKPCESYLEKIKV